VPPAPATTTTTGGCAIGPESRSANGVLGALCLAALGFVALRRRRA